MQTVKKVILIIADLIGLNLLFRRLNRDKIRILMYHGVTEQAHEVANWTVVDRRQFETQMDQLAACYHVISGVDFLSPNQLPPYSALVSFDDGLDNNYTVVWPILKQKRLNAVCFVLTGLSADQGIIWADRLRLFLLSHPGGELDLSEAGLGKYQLVAEETQRRFQSDRIVELAKQLSAEDRSRLMNLTENQNVPIPSRDAAHYSLMTLDRIAELAQSEQFEIGLHSHTHPIMATLSRKEQEDEIDRCLDCFKSYAIPFVPIFAYPNGRPQDFNEDTIAVLKARGIAAALTTVEGLWKRSSDRYRIQRIGVGADMNRWEFKARLSGFYYFLTGLAGR